MPIGAASLQPRRRFRLQLPRHRRRRHARAATRPCARLPDPPRDRDLAFRARDIAGSGAVTHLVAGIALRSRTRGQTSALALTRRRPRRPARRPPLTTGQAAGSSRPSSASPSSRSPPDSSYSAICEPRHPCPAVHTLADCDHGEVSESPSHVLWALGFAGLGLFGAVRPLPAERATSRNGWQPMADRRCRTSCGGR